MIDSIESLRGLYGEARERSRKKQLSRLDRHCLRFVGLSPFVVLASGSAAGQYDASPRGGEPGFVRAPDEDTLRVNGRARLDASPELMAHFAGERRAPKIVIEVRVEDAYLHCAKAFMRSKLWDPATQVERSTLPSMGQMIADQIGTPGAGETQEQMVARYKADI